MQDFINLYPISKTLRMKLEPTTTTQQTLQRTSITLGDRERYESYKTVKLALDELHLDFLHDVMSQLILDTSELEAYALTAANKGAKKTDIYIAAKPILERFKHACAATGEKWSETYKLKKPFISTPETQLMVLGQRYEEIANKLKLQPADLAKMLKNFGGFSGYFSAYQINRLNIYAPELKSTSAVNRMLHNLLKFHKNAQKYAKYYRDNQLVPEEYAALFTLQNYQNFITQKGISDYNRKIGELHQYINELRQQKRAEKERAALPLFEVLYKQILAKPDKSFSFDQIKTQADFTALMRQLQQALPDDIKALKEHFLEHIANPTETDYIYLNTRGVNTLVYSHTTDPDLVRSYLPREFIKSQKNSTQGNAAQNFLSLSTFFNAIDEAQSQVDESIVDGKKTESPHAVVWSRFCSDLQEKINLAEQAIKDFVNLSDFEQRESNTEIIKKALDTYNDIYKMYTYFELRYKNEPVENLEINEDFYQIFQPSNGIFLVDKEERFSRKYDLTRNWLTKKPYSLDKWVLKFDCGQLLTGWDINKEPEKHGAIIKDLDGNFYLVILTNEGRNSLDRKKNPELFDNSDGWQKMEYKLLPGPNKMLPKCFFSKKYREKNNIPTEIDDLYKNGEFKKGDKFKLSSLHKLIDFYKDAIETYPGWEMFDFNFRPTAEYESIDQFYFDVELGGYRLDFVPINHAVLENLEEEGLLYIFKITNKDLRNPNHKTPNLHTLYFLESFKPYSNIKLNGEAEVFFRPKSIETKELKNVKTPRGDNIIKYRRFMRDQYMLHLPITLNRTTRPIANVTYNQHAIERIKSNGVDVVIGIDRGENHLLYIAVVDINGKLIAKPENYDTIPAPERDRGEDKNYLKKLEAREEERRSNRQNWEVIREIKDLKAGYISFCVKRVVDLMLKYNAVVALENLNPGFKQKRARIEKSTYSQFEQALLNKLRYVVKKKADPSQPFGAQRGVQLAPPDVSPASTINHMGFVFYVNPSYTSQIDPTTGYRQQFRIDERVNAGNFRQFINAFDDIYYEDNNLLFKFNWRKLATAYNKLSKNLDDQHKDSSYPDQDWTITANVVRAVYQKRRAGKKENYESDDTKKINCQEKLLGLFKQNNITTDKNIKQQLIDGSFSSDFVRNFIRTFNLINKLRNKIDNKDAIISPVYPDGFNSTTDNFNGFEWDGDANGAYNIARKGTVLLRKLREAKTVKDFDRKATLAEYDDFYAQSIKQ